MTTGKIDPSSFGGRLTQAIKISGQSQKKIAEVLGVSENTVGNWKSGTHHPGGRNLLGLADLLGVSPAHLSGEQPDESRSPPPRLEGDAVLACGELFDALATLKGATPQLRALADSLPTLLEALAAAEPKEADE
jgi:transcriptional regulator with XRE-family HTH domain